MTGVYDLLAGILPDDFGTSDTPGIGWVPGNNQPPQMRPSGPTPPPAALDMNSQPPPVPMPRPRPDAAPPVPQAPGREVVLGNQGAPGVGWTPGTDALIGAGGGQQQQPPSTPWSPGPQPGVDPAIAGGALNERALPPPAPQQAQNVPLPPPRPPMPANVPLPQPRPAAAPQAAMAPVPPQFAPGIPPIAPGGPAALPPNAAPAVGTGGPAAAPRPPGPPAPPPFAGPQRGNGPYPETLPLDKNRQVLAGLASGLGSIQGPGRFASFARGAGQGLTGSEKNQQEQTKENRAAQGQHFNQLSTSFRDMQAAALQGNMQALREAQAKYLLARADAVTKGGTGSNAYQNTPAGRLNMAETRIQAFDSQRRKSIDAQIRSGQITQDQAKAAYGQLDQQTEAFRQQIYKGMGINQQQAEQIKTQGLTKDNPFDARTMSPDEFHSQVPLGGFYVNKDGKVYQRSAPPPGHQQHSEADTANDDEMAMTG